MVRCNHKDENGEVLYTWIEYDARGIPLGRCCDLCRDELRSKFRPDVLTDPNYWSDEPIEPEY